MGEGDKRRFKRNARYDSRELARYSAKIDGAEREQRGMERAPRGSEPPALSRASTLDDPFTTSLLAEVVRRSRTIEVLPEQIDEAKDLEPGAPDEHGPPDEHRAGTPADPNADAAKPS